MEYQSKLKITKDGKDLGKEESVDVMAVKLPMQYMDFVKRNPRIAEKAGKLFTIYLEMRKAVSEMKQSLSTPGLLDKHLDNGTPEELQGFIKAVLDSTEDSVMTMTDVKKSSLKTIQDKMLEKYGSDKVVITTLE